MSTHVGMPVSEGTPEKVTEKKHTEGEQPESVFLTRTNWLSDDDPIESAVLDYASHVDDDTALTNADQLRLVQDVKYDVPYSRYKFTEANMGLLATLAYPFKSYSYDNTEELMDAASFALLTAAVEFDTRIGGNFINFAAPTIQDALVAQVPWAKKYAVLKPGEEPVYTIIRLTSKMKKIQTPSEKAQKTEQDKAILSEEALFVLRENADVLQYIHLTDKEIHDEYGISYGKLYATIREMCDRLGVADRPALALMCLKAGISFDLRPIPEGVEFTALERQLGPLWHLPHAQIAEALDRSIESVHNAATVLRKKLNARSRTEAILMTNIAGIEPIHEAFLPFTTTEQKVLPYLTLETEEIASKLNLSNSAVNKLVMNAARRVNVVGRRGLALYLHQNGFKFEVAPLPKPLHELFDSKQMVILQNLHLTNIEIANILGSTEKYVNSIVNNLQNRAGAKNRIELMLQAHMFDTGERREPDERTKREKLVAKLGWRALDIERLNELLDSMSERQRIFIKEYYLSPEEVNWRTVADEHQMSIHVVMSAAREGIAKIIKINKTKKEGLRLGEPSANR